MGISFFEFLKSKNGTTKSREIACTELFEAAQEYQIRELAFWSCVNYVANILGRCEFRTFQNGKETMGREYYLWNFEPNVNQNSTMFLHKFVARLFTDNEALIVSTRRRDGYDALVVADEWERSDSYPSKQNEYKRVVVGDMRYDKTFRENEVLRVKLHHTGIYDVIKKIYSSYYRLMAAAIRAYEWDNGQHWKVSVSQIAQGDDGWTDNFAKMIESQVKPFLESNGAILPEFEGYKYDNVGQSRNYTSNSTRDIKEMIDDIFDFTARGFLIPSVIVKGNVEETGDAEKRLMTYCVDPICDQLQEEIVRKRYGFDEWKSGNFLRIDSSAVQHFDFFDSAASVEKLIGSGAYSINDVRRASNQTAIDEPWANEHMITRNFATMTEAVNNSKNGGEQIAENV